ncbi:MAG: plastocyanin/azurin family copper-binding protein [Gemmatimonadota bacterium]
MKTSRGSLFCAVCAVALAACSGDSAPPEAGARAESTAGAVAPAGGTTPGPHRVVIRLLDDMTFDPSVARITAGDTVVWVNDGAVPHTTTADPSAAGNPENVSLPAGATTWDSGFLNSGETFRLVISVPGDYTYLCTLHEAAGMVGRLRVRAAAPADDAD